MPAGVLMNETPPGGSTGGWIDNSGWPNDAFNLYQSYIRNATDFATGPDAQGPIMHRTWDPGDGRTANSKINLCFHPIYESFQEIYENEGTPFDASMVRTYSRKFRVLMREAVYGPAAACSCPGIPWPYSAYVPGRAGEYDLLARAIRISAKRELTGEKRSWVVQVDYSTQMPEGGPIPANGINLGWSTMGAQNAPWDEPPHLEWDPETTTKTPLIDLDGKAFVNAAKQLIYPAPAVEEGVSVLVVRRNKKFQTLEEVRRHIETFSFAVNADVFLGASPGQALSTPPKAIEMYRGPLRYWSFTYRIKFKKQDTPVLTWLQHLFPDSTWQPKMLNAGMYEIRQGWFGADPAGTLVPIFRGGQPVNYPVPLTKEGVAASPGQENWLNFRYYPSVAFQELILPQSKW